MAASGSNAGADFWTGVMILVGGGLLGVVAAGFGGRDEVMKAVYRIYREQWTRNPMDAVRPDQRFTYRQFKYFNGILAACIAAALLGEGIFRLVKAI